MAEGFAPERETAGGIGIVRKKGGEELQTSTVLCHEAASLFCPAQADKQLGMSIVVSRVLEILG